MTRRARRFVEDLTWERAGDQVEAALRHFLATPTRPLGPRDNAAPTPSSAAS
jgi:hypothetical protein